MDFYLFMADRVKHIEQRVRPVDEDGGLVVSGRYADSTRVYQPVALVNAGVFDNQWEAKNFIEHTMRPWNYEPDLTIYIDIPVELAMKRVAGDEEYEKKEFLEQVKENYEELCDRFSHRYVRVDGTQSKEEVKEEVLDIINDHYQEE